LLSKQTNTAVLIFSGYNIRGIIAFCRFCKREKITFSIIANGEKDPVFETEYRKDVIAVRKDNLLTAKHIIDYAAVMKTVNAVTKILLLPSTEYLNRVALDFRRELEEEGIIIPLCEKEIYQSLSDKYEFSKICKKSSIAVPGELNTLQEESIPFVAKPRYYVTRSSQKIEAPILINSKKDYEQLKRRNDLQEFYFQKFLGGQSIYLLYYFSFDGNYSVYAQENLIQQNKGKSIIAAKSIAVFDNVIVNQFANLLQSMAFHGLIMIEVKFFEGKYYMIEANPRIWGPSQLLLDAGMDLFYLFAFENGLIKAVPELKVKEGVKYFWSGGIFEDQSKGEMPVFHQYSPEEFFKENAEWCKADLYMKNDTFKVYQRELNSLNG
jgi:predicted ATP-grasp superfamily ATP-dependent carboligase